MRAEVMAHFIFCVLFLPICQTQQVNRNCALKLAEKCRIYPVEDGENTCNLTEVLTVFYTTVSLRPKPFLTELL